MKKQLNEAIVRYFGRLLEKLMFRQIDEKEYNLGAYIDYESELLFIRFVNDKGIVSLDIGPVGQPEKARDINFYKEMLEPPAQGHWNLSHLEKAEYLERNHEWFKTHLSGNGIDLTIKKVDDCARKRLKHLSG